MADDTNVWDRLRIIHVEVPEPVRRASGDKLRLDAVLPTTGSARLPGRPHVAVGTIMAFPLLVRRKPPRWVVEWVFVEPPYRRLGVATELYYEMAKVVGELHDAVLCSGFASFRDPAATVFWEKQVALGAAWFDPREVKTPWQAGAGGGQYCFKAVG